MSGGVERANRELLQRHRSRELGGAESPLLGALATNESINEQGRHSDRLPETNKDEAIDNSIRQLLATGALSGATTDRRRLPHHIAGDPVNFIG